MQQSTIRRWGTRGATLVAGTAMAAMPLVSGITPAHAATGWDAVAQCESGGDPSYNDGTFFGLYNFDRQTWQSLGYSGTADQYSAAVQTQAAERLYAQRGAEPWPVCGKYLSGGASVSTTQYTTHHTTGTNHVADVDEAPNGSLLGPWLVQIERRDVERVQQALNHRGQHLVVDGRYGPRTAAAVRAFQHLAGIAADGIYGPQTSRAIGR